MTVPASRSAGAHVLVVDDDEDILRLLTMRLRARGFRVTAVGSAEQALAQIAVDPPRVVVSDVRLPGQDGLALFEEIRRTRADAAGHSADGARQHPRCGRRHVPRCFRLPDQALRQPDTARKDRSCPVAVGADLAEVGDEVPATVQGDDAWMAGVVFRSSRMAELMAEARMVAASDASVLIRGESGTGKEVLARAIHRASPRAKGPFVAINCGAIPEQLLESELFGHAKGAFTGAGASRVGLFQAANGGTLFLDEIGDMPLALQVKLLRVLQERVVRPVGTTKAEPVDVRLLSATHRDLDAAMAQGQFREDLYYRLDVVSLNLPRLDERREDIPLLASHFVQLLAGKYGKPVNGFAPEALEALATASWPGNVRQLFNVVEQSCALTSTPLIPLTLVQRALRVPAMDALTYADAKQRFERNYLVQLLKLTDGSVADAARIAERNRTEFYRLLQKHDLTPAMFRSESEGAAER
jgi:two-component system response regulator GlrR